VGSAPAAEGDGNVPAPEPLMTQSRSEIAAAGPAGRDQSAPAAETEDATAAPATVDSLPPTRWLADGTVPTATIGITGVRPGGLRIAYGLLFLVATSLTLGSWWWRRGARRS